MSPEKRTSLLASGSPRRPLQNPIMIIPYFQHWSSVGTIGPPIETLFLMSHLQGTRVGSTNFNLSALNLHTIFWVSLLYSSCFHLPSLIILTVIIYLILDCYAYSHLRKFFTEVNSKISSTHTLGALISSS